MISVVLARASVAEVMAWSAALIVLLVLGMVWAMRLKRRMKEQDDAPAPAAGFTLSDLRDMHRTGQLTDEEFAKARDKVVEAAKKAAERIPAASATTDRDSPDAIRARRMAREQAERDGLPAPDDPKDGSQDAGL